ncbi:hypothetical protein [Flavobacterium sp. I3-2]|uniref:hypothetical protein n=1 Tax=Flavobacterium sp. I3-2 TaxID=2748319 RepID=UPI0015AC46C6|nr:hypothetical protein [Flavobacterium sp. I3-2]
MKKLLLLLFVSINAFAQEKYEAFEFEGKFGVVNTNTLEEFVIPTFDSYAPVFEDDVAVTQKAELYLFDKMTGEQKKFTSHYDIFYSSSNEKYFYFKEDKKGVVVPTKKSNQTINFDKNYQSIESIYGNLLAKNKESYDVFSKDNYDKPKWENIRAEDIYNDYFLNKKTKEIQKIIILYGKENVLVYDDSFDLIKEYKEAVTNQKKLFELISSDFEVHDKNFMTDGRERDIKSWEFVNDNDFTIITLKEKNISFKIKGDYVLSNLKIYYSYRNEKEIENWISLIDTTSKMKVSFIIDFDNNKILLPKKYQKLLNIKML